MCSSLEGGAFFLPLESTRLAPHWGKGEKGKRECHMDSPHELSEWTPLFKLVCSWGSGPTKEETKVLSH